MDFAGWEKMAGLAVIVWTVTRFAFTPLFDQIVFKVLDRNDENKARFRDLVSSVLQEELAAQEDTGRVVTQLGEHLETAQQRLDSMGQEFTKQLTRAVEDLNRSTNRQTELLDTMQKELTSQGKDIAGLTKAVEIWDGLERRSTRRHDFPRHEDDHG